MLTKDKINKITDPHELESLWNDAQNKIFAASNFRNGQAYIKARQYRANIRNRIMELAETQPPTTERE